MRLGSTNRGERGINLVSEPSAEPAALYVVGKGLYTTVTQAAIEEDVANNCRPNNNSSACITRKRAAGSCSQTYGSRVTKGPFHSTVKKSERSPSTQKGVATCKKAPCKARQRQIIAN